MRGERCGGGRTQHCVRGFECEARLLLGALPRRARAHAQLLLIFLIKSIVVVVDLQVEVRRCASARGGGRVQWAAHTPVTPVRQPLWGARVADTWIWGVGPRWEVGTSLSLLQEAHTFGSTKQTILLLERERES